MKQFIYSARDIVANDDFAIFNAKTDGLAIRDNWVFLCRVRPEKDVKIYRLAEWDTEAQIITPLEFPEEVTKDAYKFPETQSEAIKAKTAEEAQEKFNEDTKDLRGQK